ASSRGSNKAPLHPRRGCPPSQSIRRGAPSGLDLSRSRARVRNKDGIADLRCRAIRPRPSDKRGFARDRPENNPTNFPPANNLRELSPTVARRGTAPSVSSCVRAPRPQRDAFLPQSHRARFLDPYSLSRSFAEFLTRLTMAQRKLAELEAAVLICHRHSNNTASGDESFARHDATTFARTPCNPVAPSGTGSR